MSCFCTGECQRLGYCPHQGILGMFPKFCKDCGIPINENSIYDRCSRCRKRGKTVTDPDFNFTYLDENEINNCNLEVGDEIWFKRSHSDNIFHKFIDTVKDNVFRTVDTKDNVGEAGSTWSQDSWWEFDNIRILEIERNNDE